VRYLVLADVHANMEALEACLSHAEARRYDRTLVLGDLVGYGPDPNETIARVQSLNPSAMVRGNHDKVACGLEPPEGFNAVAKGAALWTYETLTTANRLWLASLAQGPLVVDGQIEICHGSPFDEDAYMFDELDAVRALKVSRRTLCLFGHTHCPIAFHLSQGRVETIGISGLTESRIELRAESKYLINPGSVGQPRDGDPRAAYGIADSSSNVVELYRVDYEIETTQAKIVKAGLPGVLAQRLAVGR
jgi:diadenosine tetraphosphatase ApaH/serine/threonine PP2A family protein phosphatase